MRNLVGILLIALSAACFGTLAILGRYAYAAGMDTFTVLFLRFSLAAIMMSVLLAARRESLPRGKILAQLIGMGALGYVGQSFKYLTAINYASGGLVALLLYLYPFFVLILSVAVFRERVTLIKVAALILALFGTALTVDPQGGQVIGALMAIAAAMIYSVYIIVGANVMKHVSPVQSSTVIFASAGAVFGAITLFNGAYFPVVNSGWLTVAGHRVDRHRHPCRSISRRA